MPANSKYLTTSNWQRFAKLSAAVLGSFLVTVSLHLALAVYIDPKLILKTAQYSLFMVWTALMFVPYLMNDGWICWLWFAGITLLFASLVLVKLPI